MSEKIVANDEGEIVIPFWKGFFYPLQKIAQSGRKFFILTISFALIGALFSSILGRTSFCGIGIEGPGIYCSSNIINLILSCLIFLLCSGIFICSWYEVSENNQKVTIRVGKKELKVAAFVLGYCCCWGGLALASYILTIRKAVPDWKEEMLFFFAMSLVILFILYLLLNAVMLIRFLQGKKWLCLRKVFWVIWDNLYKPFGWFFIYILFFTLFLRDFLAFFVRYEGFPVWLSALGGDFSFYFVLYSSIAVFVSNLSYQNKYIYFDED